MNFQEAENIYRQLSGQLAAQQITPQEFQARLEQLRLQDPQGAWWQVNQDGGWLRWDGRSWVPSQPPRPAPAQPLASPRPPQPAAPSVPPAQPTRQPALKKTPQPPQTLAQFFVLLFKGMLKSWLIKIPLSIGTALVVWIFHTYLLIGPNGGFAPGTNATLDAVLALNDRVASGTLFWTLLMLLITIAFSNLIRPGPLKLAEKLIRTPGWIAESLKRSGPLGAALLLGLGALTILIGIVQGHRLNNLLLSFLVFGSVIAQRESLAGFVSSLAWSDAQRLLKPKRRPAFDYAWVGAGLTGAALGFFAAAILPFAPYCGCTSAVILFGLMILLVVARQKGALPKALMLALLMALVFTVSPALADDGGWGEAGGSLLGWLTSEGALIAAALGLPPAIGSAIAVLLGSSLSTAIPKDTLNEWIKAGLPNSQMGLLKNRLADLIKAKIKDGYFVRNPSLWKKAWNNSIGRIDEWVRGYTGGQCQEFGEWGAKWSEGIVKDIYGQETMVTDITCFRNPWINHRATRVILPNGERMVLDFWEGVAAGEPRIYPESEWIQRYTDKLGGSPEIMRSDHEIFLGNLIRDYGKEAAYERFRRVYKKDPQTAEMMIRSFENAPWEIPEAPAQPPPQAPSAPYTPPRTTSDELFEKIHPNSPKPEK